MPELPDIEAYRVALGGAVVGRTLRDVSIDHPFFLRSTAVQPQQAVERSLARVGSRRHAAACSRGSPSTTGS